jgi:hypothetical protein
MITTINIMRVIFSFIALGQGQDIIISISCFLTPPNQKPVNIENLFFPQFLFSSEKNNVVVGIFTHDKVSK